MYQCTKVNYVNMRVLGTSLCKVPLFLGMRYYLLTVFCNELFVNAVRNALIS